MKALITGASSGIGRDMARYLASLNWSLILVARSGDSLSLLASQLGVSVRVIELDLSVTDNVYKLYDLTKDEDIDLLVNNAGFGLFGKFSETDMDLELKMVNVNVLAYHILTKLFLKDFVAKNKGHILNVCSSAGFLAGPNMAVYYATKNYVTKLTMAIYEELKHQDSFVVVSCLCPGPVRTNFNKVAHGDFAVNGLDSYAVARYGINKCLRGKLVIVPGLLMKVGLFLSRFMPSKLLLKFIYHIQYRKVNKV